MAAKKKSEARYLPTITVASPTGSVRRISSVPSFSSSATRRMVKSGATKSKRSPMLVNAAAIDAGPPSRTPVAKR